MLQQMGYSSLLVIAVIYDLSFYRKLLFPSSDIWGEYDCFCFRKHLSSFDMTVLMKTVKDITAGLFQANTDGVGVLGVVEVNFLDPTHIKQDFNRTDKYQ